MKSKLKSLNFSNYVLDSNLAKTNANLSFGTRIGDRFQVGGGHDIIVPGIAVTETCLNTGRIHSANNRVNGFLDPINRAARALYTKYWSKNSSISNFQEMDVMLYTYSTAECVKLISWLKAIYAACFYSNTRSKYNRDALLTAYGVDPADMQRHINDLESYINTKIVDLNTIWLDATLPIYAMCAEAHTPVLMDSPNTNKTQYYVTRPGHVMKYVIASDHDAGYIESSYIDATALTFSQLTTRIDEVFNAALKSYTIAQLSAAIEKSGVPAWKIDYVRQNEACVPFFDEAALYQLKNAVVMDPTINSDAAAGILKQDIINRVLYVQGDADALITSDAELSEDSALARELLCDNKTVLTAPSQQASTPEDVVLLASMKAQYVRANAGYTFGIGNSGVICPEFCRVYQFYGNGSNFTEYGIGTYTTITTELGAASEQSVKRLLSKVSCIAQFSFLPALAVHLESSTLAEENEYLLDEFEYSTPITGETVDKILQTAITTAFGVPEA